MVEHVKPTLDEMCESLQRHTFPHIKTFNCDIWKENVFLNNKVTEVANYHTDKYYVHSYMPVYDKLFQYYRDDNINVLEIGVQKGGSLYLWSKYFQNASVFGIDIEDSPTWLKNISNITTFKENAYSRRGVNLFEDKTLDILIDDGPHTLDSMKYISRNYLYKMKKYGLVVIEDIPQLHWIKKILDEIPYDIDYKYEIHDLREKKNRFDDIMLVILIT